MKRVAEIYSTSKDALHPVTNHSPMGSAWHPIKSSHSLRLFNAFALKWDGTLETKTLPPSPTKTVKSLISSRTASKLKQPFAPPANVSAWLQFLTPGWEQSRTTHGKVQLQLPPKQGNVGSQIPWHEQNYCDYHCHQWAKRATQATPTACSSSSKRSQGWNDEKGSENQRLEEKVWSSQPVKRWGIEEDPYEGGGDARKRAQWTYLLFVCPPHGLDHALFQRLLPWQRAQGQWGSKFGNLCGHGRNHSQPELLGSIVNPHQIPKWGGMMVQASMDVGIQKLAMAWSTLDTGQQIAFLQLFLLPYILQSLFLSILTVGAQTPEDNIQCVCPEKPMALAAPRASSLCSQAPM